MTEIDFTPYLVAFPLAPKNQAPTPQENLPRIVRVWSDNTIETEDGTRWKAIPGIGGRVPNYWPHQRSNS